jgi:choline dehydrogenase-like flavoprotein
LVGRFFQDHLLADIGVLKTSALDRLQHFFNTYYHRGLKYAPRFSAADDLQRRDRILNISAFLEFETSPDSAYVAAKEAYQQLRRRWINGALLRKLAQCALHLPELLRPVYAYLVQHRAYSPAVVPHVRILSEQEPTAESRISLSESKDALGMPRSRIHWQLTELTRHTLTRYAEVLRAEFARTGLGELQPPEWLRDGGTDWRRWVSDSYHHMGAARMHDSPAQGVVNRDCRVHGLDNLYVGSSAVFPTSSHSNPTLTLLALSLRLADHVRQRLETESPGV